MITTESVRRVAGVEGGWGGFPGWVREAARLVREPITGLTVLFWHPFRYGRIAGGPLGGLRRTDPGQGQFIRRVGLLAVERDVADLQVSSGARSFMNKPMPLSSRNVTSLSQMITVTPRPPGPNWCACR